MRGCKRDQKISRTGTKYFDRVETLQLVFTIMYIGHLEKVGDGFILPQSEDFNILNIFFYLK